MDSNGGGGLKPCNAVMMYDPDHGFRAVISTATNVLFDSGWHGFVCLTDVPGLYVQVHDINNDGTGFLTYDEPDSRINFYSYAGIEAGWYTYSIEGSIEGIALVTGNHYNVLPLTSYSYSPTSQPAELVETDFSAEPDMTIEVTGQTGPDYWTGTRPVPETYGGAFLFASDIGITTWNHYAIFYQGVQGTGTWTRAGMAHRSLDDGIAQCVLTMLRSDGAVFYGPWSGPLPGGPYQTFYLRDSLLYNPVNGIRGVVRSADGNVVYDSGWYIPPGYEALEFYVSHEFMEVNNSGYEGFITYDAANSRYNFRSQAGWEGGYPYRIEGFVESWALRYGIGDLSAMGVSTPGEWKQLPEGASRQLAA